jgi:hypothetical protein
MAFHVSRVYEDKRHVLNIMHINTLKPYFKEVESKGFWRWYKTVRITGLLDFVHRPEF